MPSVGFNSDREFEDRVREIARILWPESEFAGAQLYAGGERDGVFVTEDMVHIIEATTSRRREPIAINARKTADMAKDLRREHPDKLIKGWIVTLHEPLADQRAAVSKIKGLPLVICSYSQFCQRIVDAPTYLELRLRYGFGSARNPADLTDFRNVGDYVDMDIVEEFNGSNNNPITRLWTIDQLVDELENNRRVIVLEGDFGSGKSMTLREMFMRLRKSYFHDSTRQFPVYLNLRDHWAQRSPVEALERHAREIGYPNERQLVRARRSGFALIILDGFDEVAAEGWAGKGERLSALRQRAMIMVRKFISDSPKNVSLVIAGRSHFFDSKPELRRSLGLGPNQALHLTLNDSRASR